MTTWRPLAFAFQARGVAGRLAAAVAFFAAAVPPLAAWLAGAAVTGVGAADPLAAGASAGGANSAATPLAGPAAPGLNHSPSQRRKATTMYVCRTPGARLLTVYDEPTALSTPTNVPFGCSSRIS